MATVLSCPACPDKFEVSEGDPDATLADLWDHTGTHSRNRQERERLFVQAQESAG